MARQSRLVLPDGLHHLLQRGNNRQPVFLDDEDRQRYLDALREAVRLHGVLVHGYALMDDHVHLLVTPQRQDSLARALQTLGRRYVVGFNRRHGRSGTLWEGRYRTTLVEAASHFHPLLRYVEQHAVRSGLAESASEARWSSAPHHLGLRRDPLLSEHPQYWALGNTPFEREAAHRRALAQALEPAELALIRRHVHSGWPLLSEGTRRSLADRLERPLAPRRPGRPPAHPSPCSDSVPK